MSFDLLCMLASKGSLDSSSYLYEKSESCMSFDLLYMLASKGSLELAILPSTFNTWESGGRKLKKSSSEIGDIKKDQSNDC